MKHLVLLFLAALCIAAPLRSQDLSTATWYFGIGGGLSFTTTPPTVLTDGQTSSSEGVSIICDSLTGAPIAYSDGDKVWRGDHSVAATGVGGRMSSSTQACVFIRHPGDPTIVYLFTVEHEFADARAQVTTCSYVGGIFSVGTTQVLATGVCEKVTSSKACNGIDYWVIMKLQNGTFFSYRISSANGFELASRVNSPGGLIATPPARGEMKISPNGRWLAAVNEAVGTEVCAFNNANGVVTITEQFDLGQQRYGLSFSPNSLLLYTNTGWNIGPSNVINQYDLTAAGIGASRMAIGNFASNVGPGCMMIAPNGQIYVARWQGSHLGAIRNPDVRGIGCSYNDTEIFFGPGKIQWGLPNVPQNYFIPRFAGKDTTVCEGSSFQLGIPAQPGYIYSWVAAPTISDTRVAQPTVVVDLGVQRYFVQVTDPNGCVLRSEMELTGRPRPVISGPPNTYVCLGDSITLRIIAPPGSTVNWTPAIGLNTTTSDVVVLTPPRSQAYRVTVTDTFGCVALDTIFISVHTPTKPDLAPQPTLDLCQGSSLQLSIGTMPGTVLWSTGATTPQITVTSGGPYWVAVTDTLGCTGRDTVGVVILPQPGAAATGDTTICAGRSAPMQASGGVSYRWTPTTGLNDPTSATPIATPTQTTRYDVEVTGANGCTDTASVTITVRILPAIVIPTPDTTICGCDSLVLTAPPGYAAYLWSDSSTSQSIVVNVAGLYSVTVTDDLGCTDISNVVRIDTFTTLTEVSTLIIPYAAPDGANVNVQIAIKNWPSLAPCFGDSISWIIAIQTGVLAPATEAGRGVMTDSGVRLVRGVSRWDGIQTEVVTQIPYIVTLGDTTLTNVTVMSVQGSPCAGTIFGSTAGFGVEEICRAGGLIRRFISPARYTGILSADPNPAFDAVVMRMRIDVQQNYHLEIRDVLGQIVLQTSPASGGPGIVTTSLDVGSLAPGKYIITLVAGNERSGYLLEVL
ncbi:MAG: T9SS type A sorting domain-containing protein [bacterium]|nr:T9SS type A sorting domain-containing protein [bacterium]